MNWFKKRLAEPTTYIGAGLLAQAVMVLTKSNPAHLEVVGSVIQQASAPLAAGDYVSAVPFFLSGLMAIFMSEKAAK
ncbi:MAG: hypothetical protein COB36_11090 [Alphaproteobacteria bacterium]|nr:MAG: hypothetical protein COB36_11090 [Alphaproteobacteria bacterium]